MSMDEETLKKALLELGWRWVYYTGNGDACVVTEGEYVVGDIEKSMILVPPDCIWKEPILCTDYF